MLTKILSYCRLPRSVPRLAFMALLAATVVGCTDEGATGVGPSPLSLSVVSGDQQSGPVGQELPSPVVIRVTAIGRNGRTIPVSGKLVNFRVVKGGGTVYAGTAMTDRNGFAQDYWTLARPGQNVLEVRAVDPTTGAKESFATLTALGLRQLVFESDRKGDDNIFIMNEDGSGVTQLTVDPAIDETPRWSPDGSQIVFVSLRDGDQEIYRMSADGTNATRLTNNPALDGAPVWSPDGSQIAFASTRDAPSGCSGSDCHTEVYVMSAADGSNVRRLTNNLLYDDGPGAWSPDGTKIYFASNRSGSYELYVMNQADGSGVTRLTTSSPAFNRITDISPDGSKILFDSNRDGLTSGVQVYVMNADGSAVTRLTNSYPYSDYGAYWSTDGQQIAFASFREGNVASQIWVMNADGSQQHKITNPAPVGDAQPVWRPY